MSPLCASTASRAGRGRLCDEPVLWLPAAPGHAPGFGALVKAACERAGRGLSPPRRCSPSSSGSTWRFSTPTTCSTYRIFEENAGQGQVMVDFEGVIRTHRVNKEVMGRGQLPPSTLFFNALRALGLTEYEFVSYSEHAVATGADSKAVAISSLRRGDETFFWRGHGQQHRHCFHQGDSLRHQPGHGSLTGGPEAATGRKRASARGCPLLCRGEANLPAGPPPERPPSSTGWWAR